MPTTMQQVLAEIDREEPNYAAFAALGADALPHLQMIAEANDPLRSAKAVYAASMIGGSGALALLKAAAEHHEPQVRIAVAHGLQNLAEAAPSELVLKSLSDAHPGVRKLALRTAGQLKRAEFAARVTEMHDNDPAEHLRSAAGTAAKLFRVKVPVKVAPKK